MVEPSGLTPHDKTRYEQEYRQSVDLFQKALTQYSKSEDPYRQHEYEQVMKQALTILNETANQLMQQELQKQNAQIAKDYAAFQKNPSSQEAVKNLQNDLTQAKKKTS